MNNISTPTAVYFRLFDTISKLICLRQYIESVNYLQTILILKTVIFEKTFCTLIK